MILPTQSTELCETELSETVSSSFPFHVLYFDVVINNQRGEEQLFFHEEKMSLHQIEKWISI